MARRNETCGNHSTPTQDIVHASVKQTDIAATCIPAKFKPTEEILHQPQKPSLVTIFFSPKPYDGNRNFYKNESRYKTKDTMMAAFKLDERKWREPSSNGITDQHIKEWLCHFIPLFPTNHTKQGYDDLTCRVHQKKSSY